MIRRQNDGGQDSPQSSSFDNGDQRALQTAPPDRDTTSAPANTAPPTAPALQSEFGASETSISVENFEWLSGELSWDMDTLYDAAAFDEADWLEHLPSLINGDSVANPEYPSGMPLLSTQAQPISMLSRPGSPPASHANDVDAVSSLLPSSSVALTKESYERLEGEVALVSDSALPPLSELCRFIRSYFSSFHRHQPFLHEASWSPQQSPPTLILALCANGALYDLEATVAKQLFDLALQLRSVNLSGLPFIQAYFLMIAFMAWSGSSKDIESATQLSANVIPELRRQWIDYESQDDDHQADPNALFRKECLRRSAYLMT